MLRDCKSVFSNLTWLFIILNVLGICRFYILCRFYLRFLQFIMYYMFEISFFIYDSCLLIFKGLLSREWCNFGMRINKFIYIYQKIIGGDENIILEEVQYGENYLKV